MLKRITILLAGLSAFFGLSAQIELAFDISDNADRINCYTTSKTTNKEVLVTYQITNNSTCGTNCIYLWADGEDDGTSTEVDLIKFDGTPVSFNYTTDGEFTPSLVVFDNTSLPDSIKQSTILSITNGVVKGSTVEVFMKYETPNGQFLDTVAFLFSQVDTAEASSAASKIQVYSPVTGIPFSEVTTSPNADSLPDFPYPQESFLHTFTPNKRFAPFDDQIWVYYWDFGLGNFEGTTYEEKERRNVKLTSDTIDHLFPYENLEGFNVKLVIALDSSKFSANQISTYDLSGCYDVQESKVIVEDYFFDSGSRDDVNVKGRTPYVPNTFTPNGDNVNDVFTFATNGQDYFTVNIYNRWGNLVYEQAGYAIAWDGNTNSGGACSSGVYYYIITSDRSDERHNVRGFIHLFKEE